jgi:hypothetical protein
MAKGTRQSGDKAASTAGKVLANGGKATPSQARTLAASVLSQDQTKGKRGR